MQNAFRLGDWLVRPQRSIIERGDESVHLKPKSMAVLECLALNGGDVVSRDDLFEAVWRGSVVSDERWQCIVELRKAFGDTAHDAHFIETIPKKGFRLVPEVWPPPKATKDHRSVDKVVFGAAWIRPVIFIPVLGAIVLGLLLYWFQANIEPDRNRTLVIEDSQTLAVLPFVDMSPDEDQEHFADGISEELLNRLSRLENLRVTGRTSAFFFKGKGASLDEIGETLNVAHILEGSVRKTKDMLRITTQLVNTSNGFQVWSETYDRSAEDIFAIQDDIAESVAMALSISLGVGELGRQIGSTSSVEAYNEYLLGQSLYRKFTPESVRRATEHFIRATEIDPEYAIAWGRLADIRVGAKMLGIGLDDWVETSLAALDRAIALAPTATSVIQTRGFRYMHLTEWGNGQRVFEEAGLQNSNDANSLNTYSQILTDVGRGRDVIEIEERARVLDPLSGVISFTLAHLYAEDGRLDEAMLEFERGYLLGEYQIIICALGLATALVTQDHDLIRLWLDRVMKHSGSDEGVHTAMAELLGDREAAISWLRDTPVTNFHPVWAAYYGDDELALSSMHGSSADWTLWTPNASGVRKLPGFKDLVTERGMVEYWREFDWGYYCRPVGDDDFECE